MRSTRVALPFMLPLALFAVPAAAQSVQITLTAPNQLVTSTSVGALGSAALGPTGVLAPSASVTSSLGNGAATAQLTWITEPAPGATLDSDIQLRILASAVVSPSGGLTTTATVPVSEFVLTLQATAPRQVFFAMERELQSTVGVSAPVLQVDLFDDGAIDFDGTAAALVANVLDIGAAPTPIRIRVGGGVSSATAGTALLAGIKLDMRPENRMVLNRFYTGCAGTFAAEPSFATGGITFSGESYVGDFVVLALGFGLQPVVTPSIGTGPVPCVFFPTPDLVFLLQAPPATLTPMQLALPPAVRPVAFYAQALNIGGQGFTASDAYLVSAW